MCLAWEYVGPQPQVFVLLRPKVDEQITIWFARRVFICLDSELRRLRIHLSREIGELARVSGILEENHVVRIQTHRSRELVFRKEVLSQEQYANVPMMGTFRKQVCYRLVRFLHQIVYDE